MNLDQFSSLERVGSTIYIGYNEGIERIVFAKLTHIDGALVIEGNAKLVEVSFPVLEKVARYVHIHDNAALERVGMPKLLSAPDGLSLVDNPQLVHVKIASSDKPAELSSVELKGNGNAKYAQLHVR